MGFLTDAGSMDSAKTDVLKRAFGTAPTGKLMLIQNINEKEIAIACEEGTLYIYADFGSIATLVEKDTKSLRNRSIFIYLAKGARITYISLQSANEEGIERTAVCEDNSELKWFIANIGSGKNRETRITKLNGYGSKVSDMELFFINDEQQLNNKTRVYHVGKNTFSRVLVKGLLKDHSTAVYDGLVKIEKTALGSDSFLGQHSLMLNPGARADTTPGLEIETSEVKAGHSASSTKINEEEIFYLRSKGISEADAKKLIALGFLYELLETMPIGKEEFYNAIELKWNKAFASSH